MAQKLYLIRGVPGSGKSTYAKKLKDDLFEQGHSVTHYEADMFFMHDGKYNWNPKLLGLAHKWCFDSVFNSFNNGTEAVIVANTFVKLKDMNTYIEMAKKHDYEVTVYRMDNHFQNVHNVPNDVINRMTENFEDYDNEIIVKESTVSQGE